MSRFSSPVIRSGGGMDIYTCLAGVAALVLLAGCLVLVFHNMEYSSTGSSDDGGIFKILETR